MAVEKEVEERLLKLEIKDIQRERRWDWLRTNWWKILTFLMILGNFVWDLIWFHLSQLK